MITHSLVTFTLFVLVASATPGPNNIMLLHSGVHFGWLRTLPHILGIILGVTLLFLSVSLGLGALLAQYSTLALLLKVASIAYLVYLSYRIIISQTQLNDAHADNLRQPQSFLGAALFQWVNPKNWAVMSAAISLYHETITTSLMTTCWIFIVSGLFSASLWASSGTLLRDFLSNAIYLKWFNRIMGTLLIASILPIIDL